LILNTLFQFHFLKIFLLF